MRNRRVAIWFIVIATVAGLFPSAAAAQTDLFSIPPGPRRVDISGSGGFVLGTDWSDLVLLGSISATSGALEQVLLRDVAIEPGPVFDGVVTYWEGRYGFRAHAGFASSCLAIAGICGGPPSLAGPSSVDVNTWTYDVGGSVGLIDYRRDAWAWPYFFLGLGAVTYDLDRSVSPPLTFIERRPPARGDGPILVSHDDPEALLIAIDELGVETQFALTLGIGSDFRVPVGSASLGIRLEISDNIHQSPIDLNLVNIDGFVPAGGSTQLDFGFVHNLRAAAGLVVSFGR